MFSKSNKCRVALKGRSGVLYSEGKYKALIESEMMTGELDLVVYFDSFQSWLPPFENDIVSKEDRNRIKQNILEELHKRGLKIEFE